MGYDAEKRRKYRQDNTSRIHNYLLEHPCVDCGEDDPIVLEFDHLRDKKATISRMVTNTRSWATITEEITKCEVRCANCHRKITAKRAQTFSFRVGKMRVEVDEYSYSRLELQHGIRNGYYRGCRCDECKMWNTRRHKRYRENKRLSGANGSTHPW